MVNLALSGTSCPDVRARRSGEPCGGSAIVTVALCSSCPDELARQNNVRARAHTARLALQPRKMWLHFVNEQSTHGRIKFIERTETGPDDGEEMLPLVLLEARCASGIEALEAVDNDCGVRHLLDGFVGLLREGVHLDALGLASHLEENEAFEHAPQPGGVRTSSEDEQRAAPRQEDRQHAQRLLDRGLLDARLVKPDSRRSAAPALEAVRPVHEGSELGLARVMPRVAHECIDVGPPAPHDRPVR